MTFWAKFWAAWIALGIGGGVATTVILLMGREILLASQLMHAVGYVIFLCWILGRVIDPWLKTRSRR